MAFPVTGALATITSITSSTDVYQLLTQALKINQVRVNEEADQFDISELSGSGAGRERVTGLISGTMDFEGVYSKATPRIGNSGLVTFASGYVQRVTGWKLDVDFGEIDITAMTGSAITAKKFMPNALYEWSGSYTAHAVDSTALSKPTAVNGVGASAEFKLTEDSTDPTLSGNIIVTSLGQTIRKGDLQVAEYAFQGAGDITETKGSTLAGLRRTSTGTWAAPDWDSDDNGTPQMILTTYTGRTLTVTVFLKSMSVECMVGQPIKVSGQIRFSGDSSRA